MGKASSAKKVAKVAESARGVKVREPRGKIFPAALAIVIILGTLLVWYSRQSSLAAAGTKPTTDDHFHVAFGVYNCDKWLGNIQNNNEQKNAADQLIDEQFKVTGIHSHGDGVIHVHPYGSAGTGKNAKLGTWLKLVGAKLSDTKFEMPESLGTMTSTDKCGDKKSSLKALVWEDATSTGEPKKYLTDFNSIRFDKSGMAITIAFTPDDNSVDLNTLKPPTAANLTALGAADSATGAPPTVTTVAGGATTIAGATTVASSDSSTTVAAASSTTIG